MKIIFKTLRVIRPKMYNIYIGGQRSYIIKIMTKISYYLSFLVDNPNTFINRIFIKPNMKKKNYFLTFFFLTTFKHIKKNERRLIHKNSHPPRKDE